MYMLCYITCVMSDNMYRVRLYNMCHVMLYMLYNTCHVIYMLCYITCVMCHVMLYKICHVI